MQIGEILRNARKEKNISLDEIQEETKIQKRYLVAIEQNDFHALPGKFYARAFIKEYAQAVDLDPAEVLQGFDETEIETEADTMQYTRMERSKRPKPKGTSFLSFLPTIIVVLLIIGIIFVAWALYLKATDPSGEEVENPSENDEIIRDKDSGGQDANNEDDPKTDDNGEEKKEDTADGDTDQEGQFEEVETGTGNSPTSTLDFTYSEDKVEVKFEVSAASYTELRGENEQSYFAGTLNPDQDSETFDVTDEDKIYFNIGNAAGLKIFINDVELEYPVDANSAVHQKLWVNLKKSD